MIKIKPLPRNFDIKIPRLINSTQKSFLDRVKELQLEFTKDSKKMLLTYLLTQDSPPRLNLFGTKQAYDKNKNK